MPRAHSNLHPSDSGAHALLAPVVGELSGHLTRAGLEAVLADMGEELEAREMAPVLLDCRNMDSYDLDARHAFVDWNKQWRSRVNRVAIVTANRLFHVVIATMALASGQAMKGFSDYDEAERWARAGA